MAVFDPIWVPLTSTAEGVHVLCADQRIPLTVDYSGSRFAPAILAARLGSLAESGAWTAPRP